MLRGSLLAWAVVHLSRCASGGRIRNSGWNLEKSDAPLFGNQTEVKPQRVLLFHHAEEGHPPPDREEVLKRAAVEHSPPPMVRTKDDKVVFAFHNIFTLMNDSLLVLNTVLFTGTMACVCWLMCSRAPEKEQQVVRVDVTQGVLRNSHRRTRTPTTTPTSIRANVTFSLQEDVAERAIPAPPSSSEEQVEPSWTVPRVKTESVPYRTTRSLPGARQQGAGSSDTQTQSSSLGPRSPPPLARPTPSESGAPRFQDNVSGHRSTLTVPIGLSPSAQALRKKERSRSGGSSSSQGASAARLQATPEGSDESDDSFEKEVIHARRAAPACGTGGTAAEDDFSDD